MEPNENQPQKTLKLLNLERELAGENAQEVYQRHDAQLADLQRRAKEEAAQPQSPEEFQRLEKLQAGVLAARKVLKFALLNR